MGDLGRNLVAAVVRDDLPAAASLLREGASPDARGEHGMTCLMLARALGMVDLLLEAGADPGALDREGGTALHALWGCMEKGARLIACGADLYRPNDEGQAALARLTGIQARLLLHAQERSGLRPTPRGAPLATALDHPALLVECQRLANQSRITDRWWISGFDALELGREDLVSTLLAEGLPLEVRNDAGGTLVTATVTGPRTTPAMLQAFLNAVVDPTQRDHGGRTAFDWALRLARSSFGHLLGGNVPPLPTDAYGRGVQWILLGREGNRAASLLPGETHPLHLGISHPRDPEGWCCTFLHALGRQGCADQRPFLAAAGAAWFIPFLERLAAGGPVTLAELEYAHDGAKGLPLPLGSLRQFVPLQEAP